jgi:hypothetical protein
MKRRFYYAMSAYAALAVLAAFTLDGNLRLIILIFLGGLALKTVAAYKSGQAER